MNRFSPAFAAVLRKRVRNSFRSGWELNVARAEFQKWVTSQVDIIKITPLYRPCVAPGSRDAYAGNPLECYNLPNEFLDREAPRVVRFFEAEAPSPYRMPEDWQVARIVSRRLRRRVPRLEDRPDYVDVWIERDLMRGLNLLPPSP